MSEVPAVLGELRTDFVERNTALFMLLGVLSLGDRLTRSLAGPPAPPSTERTKPSNFEFFALGLIGLSQGVAALAGRLAEDVPASDRDAERAPCAQMDLLR